MHRASAEVQNSLYPERRSGKRNLQNEERHRVMLHPRDCRRGVMTSMGEEQGRMDDAVISR